MSRRVWIFDLDDTLHNASAHIFPVMNQSMTRYIMELLTLEEPAAHVLRQHYWRIYGATLKGLMRHHGVDPHHFLAETHAFLTDDMVQATKQLRQLLQRLPGRKCVFTNAPRAYAAQVLDVLGISDCFTLVFSVESSRFHAKPSMRGFRMLLRQLGCRAADCTLFEDSLPALMTAKRLGMRTVWISRRLHKPNFVQYRLPHVLALTHSALKKQPSCIPALGESG
ncbi:MAG TPA: pyrimidine 5'-nucleotidase [Methylophilus sp.]|uniref:pyrimidine 5'-nucleotidase n=1 Tax=Methylophilus sp. TaxID=29541 RepID=UPI002CD06845|nr:pyrimidine 5'-nucleotidase [Methylophilus sp.]HSH86346.1 pyrimidine 5'-nucleotidase [Methylophilus sp.]